MTFDSLNLSQRLLDTLVAQGYESPTPIQAAAIPPVLEGRDLLGCAQTGTGKTAAFALPLIERLVASQPKGGAKGGKGSGHPTRALVLAPTRELAVQIEESLRTYGKGTGLRGAVIYGGVKQHHQVRQLRAGVDAIVATPGRLLDLIDQGHVRLGSVEMFVLDEADRMLDMGFIDPIRKISAYLPERRQTLLFSATMAKKIRSLAQTLLSDPVSVSVTPVASAAPLIEQTLYHVPGEHKSALLSHLLEDPAISRAVVFTRTKHGADKVAKSLGRDGVTAGSIHGNKSQSQRQRALDAFRAGRSRVLVATDVAARGLDVDGISHVFNFNLPNEPEAYVHRIGRTGRAGTEGRAVSFCSRDERSYLRAIESLTGKRIETTEVPEGSGAVDDAPVKLPRRDGAAGGRSGGKPRNGSGNKSRAGAWAGDRSDQQAGPRSKPKNKPKNKAKRAGFSADGGPGRTGPQTGAKASSGKPRSKKARMKAGARKSASGGATEARRGSGAGRATARTN